MTTRFLPLATFLLAALLRSAQCQASQEAAAVCLSDFRCQVQLSPELMMRYKIILPDDYAFGGGDNNSTEGEEECTECQIIVQLLYDGYTWLGIGPSPEGQMIGTRAVIGVPDVSDPKLYYLNGTDVDSVVPVPGNDTLRDASIQFGDGNTAMEFETSFPDWGIRSPVGPGLNNRHSFVWAHGGFEGAGALAYHGPAGRSSHTIDNLMGFATGQEVVSSGPFWTGAD